MLGRVTGVVEGGERVTVVVEEGREYGERFNIPIVGLSKQNSLEDGRRC